MTIFSPNCVGIVETRRSMRRPSNRSRLRPSCGLRRSAMSMPAMILSREIVGVLQVARDGQHVAEQSVDALPHLQLRLVRLDVDVAGAGLGRVAQDQVDEPHDGRLIGERGQVDFLLDHNLHLALWIPREELVVGGRAFCRDLGRTACLLVPPAQQRLEPGLGDDNGNDPLAGPKLDGLDRRIVERVDDPDLQCRALEAQGGNAVLAAEIFRQQLHDRVDFRRRAFEEFEPQTRGKGRSYDFLVRHTKAGQHPAQGRPGRCFHLLRSSQPGGVNQARFDQDFPDPSICAHRQRFPRVRRPPAPTVLTGLRRFIGRSGKRRCPRGQFSLPEVGTGRRPRPGHRPAFRELGPVADCPVRLSPVGGSTVDRPQAPNLRSGARYEPSGSCAHSRAPGNEASVGSLCRGSAHRV